MRHFINKNEDVLVCPEDFIPEIGWYELRCVESGFFAKCINSVGLFQTSKAHDEANFDSEETVALCILRKLSENGFKVNSIDETIPKIYRNYYFLTLATLYGGNYSKFEILKPFKLRSAFIQQDYNPKGIEQKISYLKEYGFIKLGE